jgi:hypothetical protein
MPVILRTVGECDAWLTADPAEALKMQRPLPDDALKIVAKGEKEDPPPGLTLREGTAALTPELPVCTGGVVTGAQQLPADPTLCFGEQCEKEGSPRHRPGCAVCGHAGSELRNSLRDLPTSRQCPSPEGGSRCEIPEAVLLRDGDECIRPRLQFLAGACPPIDHAGSDQRIGEAVRMTQFARLLDRRLASEVRLIEVAKATQVPREIVKQGTQGVLDVE